MYVPRARRLCEFRLDRAQGRVRNSVKRKTNFGEPDSDIFKNYKIATGATLEGGGAGVIQTYQGVTQGTVSALTSPPPPADPTLESQGESAQHSLCTYLQSTNSVDYFHEYCAFAEGERC